MQPSGKQPLNRRENNEPGVPDHNSGDLAHDSSQAAEYSSGSFVSGASADDELGFTANPLTPLHTKGNNRYDERSSDGTVLYTSGSSGSQNVQQIFTAKGKAIK
jgi:hypothetical protein